MSNREHIATLLALIGADRLPVSGDPAPFAATIYYPAPQLDPNHPMHGMAPINPLYWNPGETINSLGFATGNSTFAYCELTAANNNGETRRELWTGETLRTLTPLTHDPNSPDWPTPTTDEPTVVVSGHTCTPADPQDYAALIQPKGRHAPRFLSLVER